MRGLKNEPGLLLIVVGVTVAFPAVWIANRAVLLFCYGWGRVNREGLHFVTTKPRLEVSNGDVLSWFTLLIHFLILVFCWMAFVILSFWAIGRITNLYKRRSAKDLSRSDHSKG